MNTATQKIDVNLSRAIPATPDEVFDVWLDSKSPGGPWFGAARVILNAVVDGLFYHAVEHEGRIWAHYGRFIRLERGSVIEHTWMSEATKGIETTVTVTLARQGESTLITIRHTDLPDDQLGRSHQDGWNFMLNAIEQRFSSRKN